MIYETMLITGCGGDIAQALARIAQEAGVVRGLIGCDVQHSRQGNGFFDERLSVPRADHPDYWDKITSLIAEKGIDVVVPTSEAEIAVFLAAGALREIGGVPVIAANKRAVEIGLDKYATFELLSNFGLGVPWTRIVSVAPPVSLPCIFKPRQGQGSKKVQRVESAGDVEKLTINGAGELWQELLLPDDQEYTCGLYRNRGGELRTIVFKRQLRGGLTQSGEVVDSEAINSLLTRIAVAVDLVGSINVQLRLTSDGPKVFEINSRFSSTVGFRHRLGFRDFIWSLLDCRGRCIERYCPPPIGTRIFRAGDEIIIN